MKNRFRYMPPETCIFSAFFSKKKDLTANRNRSGEIQP
jgi:hypothetical protein